jgi:hypothetical protein
MKRIGRPPIPEGQRKTRTIPFRCGDELHALLTMGAQAAGRTVSQEIEQRLQNSFKSSLSLTQLSADIQQMQERIADQAEALASLQRSSDELRRAVATDAERATGDIGEPVRRLLVIPLKNPIQAPEGPVRSPTPKLSSPSQRSRTQELEPAKNPVDQTPSEPQGDT